MLSGKALDTTPKAQSTKKKPDTLGFTELWDVCSVTDTAMRSQTDATAWETVPAKHTSDKGLVPEMNCSTLSSREISNSV